MGKVRYFWKSSSLCRTQQCCMQGGPAAGYVNWAVLSRLPKTIWISLRMQICLRFSFLGHYAHAYLQKKDKPKQYRLKIKQNQYQKKKSVFGIYVIGRVNIINQFLAFHSKPLQT